MMSQTLIWLAAALLQVMALMSAVVSGFGMRALKDAPVDDIRATVFLCRILYSAAVVMQAVSFILLTGFR